MAKFIRVLLASAISVLTILGIYLMGFILHQFPTLESAWERMFGTINHSFNWEATLIAFVVLAIISYCSIEVKKEE